MGGGWLHRLCNLCRFVEFDTFKALGCSGDQIKSVEKSSEKGGIGRHGREILERLGEGVIVFC